MARTPASLEPETGLRQTATLTGDAALRPASPDWGDTSVDVANAILLEDGTALLLEDGTALLLES